MFQILRRASKPASWVALAMVVAVPASAEDRTPTEVVEALFAAFNDHDPERMAELVTEDFELYYMADGKAVLGVEGPEALRQEMTGYFGGLPTVRSVAETSMVSGSYVACKETVSWRHEDEERSQFSLAVYEVRDGKIRRTWYYPAER